MLHGQVMLLCDTCMFHHAHFFHFHDSIKVFASKTTNSFTYTDFRARKLFRVKAFIIPLHLCMHPSARLPYSLKTVYWFSVFFHFAECNERLQTNTPISTACTLLGLQWRSLIIHRVYSFFLSSIFAHTSEEIKFQ